MFFSSTQTTILTKYSFETPITLDIYFINTTQFTGCKWGTQNPFIMRDPEFGTVRGRGFGTYAFRVDQDNADKFLKELFGTASSFTTEEIIELGFINSII